MGPTWVLSAQMSPMLAPLCCQGIQYGKISCWLVDRMGWKMPLILYHEKNMGRESCHHKIYNVLGPYVARPAASWIPTVFGVIYDCRYKCFPRSSRPATQISSYTKTLEQQHITHQTYCDANNVPSVDLSSRCLGWTSRQGPAKFIWKMT